MNKALHILITVFILIVPGCNSDPVNNCSFSDIKRIAHGGGGYNGVIYTNSLEALDYNLKRGFEYFEIDFVWTSDKKLVCLHDWGKTFQFIFGFSIKTEPSLEIYKTWIKKHSKYRVCTFDDLINWLEENPGTRIITDIKKDNLKALEIISERVENFSSRIIPQIYHPDEYDAVRKMGYTDIIWTLYRFSGSNRQVKKLVGQLDLFAVTMPEQRALAKLGRAIRKKCIPTYVHTINSKEKVEMYVKDYGIVEVYTDFLEP